MLINLPNVASPTSVAWATCSSSDSSDDYWLILAARMNLLEETVLVLLLLLLHWHIPKCTNCEFRQQNCETNLSVDIFKGPFFQQLHNWKLTWNRKMEVFENDIYIYT